MDFYPGFYDTTYKINFFPRPGQKFYPLTKPIPEIDPTLTPGHFANNITFNGYPIQSKTWEKPNIENTPEEYKAFLDRYKNVDSRRYQMLFTNPDVNFAPLEDYVKDDKLTTYSSVYSPDYYVPRKEALQWHFEGRSKYKYRETSYDSDFNRIEETAEVSLSKPFTWHYDEEQLKKELRIIHKPSQATYYKHYCTDPLPVMKALLEQGKVWVAPLDAHTHRRV